MEDCRECVENRAKEGEINGGTRGEEMTRDVDIR